MKTFISWNGERSKLIATHLKEWLPLVLYYVDPWFSERDIEAGERWFHSVSKGLSESNFGIICLTPENLSAPWIIFESGALAKSLDTSRVIPLVLDLDFSAISGPLAQFQSKKISKEGIFDIVTSIQKCYDNPVDDSRLKHLFDSLWPQFEDNIKAIPNPVSQKPRARNQGEILEDLVANVRLLDSNIRKLSNSIIDNNEYNVIRSRRYDPTDSNLSRKMFDHSIERAKDIIATISSSLESGPKDRLEKVTYGLLRDIYTSEISIIESYTKWANQIENLSLTNDQILILPFLLRELELVIDSNFRDEKILLIIRKINEHLRRGWETTGSFSSDKD